MRRVVTDHNKDGKSVFLKDGSPSRVAVIETLPSPELTEVWATAGTPSIPVVEEDPTLRLTSLIPKIGDTQFRICCYPPNSDTEQAMANGFDLAAFQEEIERKMPGLAETLEYEEPGMHTTDTIDYEVVISGEIWLELDDSAEVHLKPGDCVVQNGTRHAWRNRGSLPCTMAFVMIGAKRA